MKKKLLTALLLVGIVSSLVGCGFSVGSTKDVATGTTTQNNHKTKDHKTTGNSGAENVNKGKASSDISDDGTVKMTTFDFTLDDGYTAEALDGVVETDHYMMAHVNVCNEDGDAIAAFYDGKTKDKWSSDPEEGVPAAGELLVEALDVEGFELYEDLEDYCAFGIYCIKIVDGDIFLTMLAIPDTNWWAIAAVNEEYNDDYPYVIVQDLFETYLKKANGGSLPSEYVDLLTENGVSSSDGDVIIDYELIDNEGGIVDYDDLDDDKKKDIDEDFKTSVQDKSKKTVKNSDDEDADTTARVDRAQSYNLTLGDVNISLPLPDDWNPQQVTDNVVTCDIDKKGISVKYRDSYYKQGQEDLIKKFMNNVDNVLDISEFEYNGYTHYVVMFQGSTVPYTAYYVFEYIPVADRYAQIYIVDYDNDEDPNKLVQKFCISF